jgi:Cof subfamily protein (haloacid dehalogenase superfamily)
VEYRLLVLDLDGTVMGSDLVISPVVRQAIASAQRVGVIVTIATGRVYNSALQFLPQLGIESPIICYQGAVVRDPVSGELLYQAGLGGPSAAEAVQMLQNDGIFVIAFHNERTWVTGPAPELDFYLSFHPGGEADVACVPDLVEHVHGIEPIKLLFAPDPERLTDIVSRYSEMFAGRMSVIRSHRYFGEITAPGVHKGTAIEALAASMGIPANEVIAIGDEENDVPMMEWAGLGLAMGNAPEAVRERADAIIPSISDDGVAWAIENYIMNRSAC